MKKTVTTLVALSMLVTAIGCGSKDNNNAASPSASSGATASASATPNNQPVKLRIAWWGGQARHDYTLKVIDLYKQKHPNVTIEAEYAAFDDYWKKLAPQAAASDLPDIIQMDVTYLSQYAGKGQLEDLQPYVKANKINLADVSQNVVGSGMYGGKLAMVSLGTNALGATVDPAALQKAGASMPAKTWTWDDMGALGAQLKTSGKLLFDTMRYDVFFPYYLRTTGNTLYSADGTQLGYADDKPFIDYYKQFQKWYDAGYMLTLDKLGQKKGLPEDDEMVLGNAFASVAWSNQFVGFSAAAKRDLELQPIPGPNGNKGLFMKPSMGFSITNNSKVKEEAAKFIDFWINDIDANKLIKGERGVPISAKVKDALKPLLTPAETKVFEYVAWAEQNSSPMDPPSPVGSVEVEKLLKDLSEQILYKKTSVEDAAAKFRKEANAILAKNKK
ncbi:ABC transporter substrate-binding protein [Paenibacillus cymbidii]|uniref:ABC transporter substrate-binding protein n=1 Tax=Paenibacillus cymbidii TaxID=1639034 RepID=UPI00107FFF00|nr:ABC transporter substrate-binding protein [Paenibacillus cymbidii]